MENETTPIDINYQKGFNEGYLVTKHWPEMSDTIAQVKNLTPRLDGFRDGRRQYVLDLTKANRPNWMQRNNNRSPEREQGKEKEGKDIDR